MRAGILAPRRAFGHAGGHFGDWTRFWALGRAFWRLGVRLGTQAGILAHVWTDFDYFSHFWVNDFSWVGILMPALMFGHEKNGNISGELLPG